MRPPRRRRRGGRIAQHRADAVRDALPGKASNGALETGIAEPGAECGIRGKFAHGRHELRVAADEKPGLAVIDQLTEGAADTIGDDRFAEFPGLANDDAKALGVAHRHQPDTGRQGAEDGFARLSPEIMNAPRLDRNPVLILPDDDEVERATGGTQRARRLDHALVALPRHLAAENKKEGNG